MTRLRWTEPAKADLRQIRDYIARDSPRYARRMIATIKRAAERLKRFPLLGEALPGYGSGDVRQIVCGNYRIVHRVLPGEVQIIAVIHGARRVEEPNGVSP